ncbi:MAG: hypothetical protein JWM11_3736 [Planctomycetaceae bacterium]|nr:hypothetical protein [Planctomycetaceae bacterium]
MALNASARKSKKSAQPDPDAAVSLQRHIESLGLKSVDEYAAWCVRHGFSQSSNKTLFQRELEGRTARRIIADSRLSQSKREHRSFLSTLRDIFGDVLNEQQVTTPALKLICQSCKSLSSQGLVRQAFFNLLTHVGDTTDLTQTQSAIPQYGRQEGNTYLGGLLALAHHTAEWIRQPSDWHPTSHNIGRQFQSLARHLFARWPVPAFMDSVWFQGTSREAQQKQRWFVHLGRGENIRTAPLPIPYSKRMSHHFMQAPGDFTVEDTLRWGQIQALGGNARLVKAILGTRLRTEYEHDDFWTTVFQFLIGNPMLDLAQVEPIIDYLQYQKFTPQEILVAPGKLERRPPPRPNLTMKGRTVDALLRNVDTWHRKLATTSQPKAEWSAAGFRGLSFVEGTSEGNNLKIWTISELLSSAALFAEGRKLRRCVGSYARSCEQGICSIWTLELETLEGRSKVLTLEIRNALKLLVQARGKCNRLPTEKERSILHRWAEQAGLQVANWA